MVSSGGGSAAATAWTEPWLRLLLFLLLAGCLLPVAAALLPQVWWQRLPLLMSAMCTAVASAAAGTAAGAAATAIAADLETLGSSFGTSWEKLWSSCAGDVELWSCGAVEQHVLFFCFFA